MTFMDPARTRARHKVSVPIPLVLLVLGSAAIAQAEPVTFYFRGEVDVTFRQNGAPTWVFDGASIDGSLTFDSAAADQNPSSSTGDYTSPQGSPYGFRVSIGGGPIRELGGPAIRVIASHSSSGSAFFVCETSVPTCSPDVRTSRVGINLTDLDGFTVATDDRLPVYVFPLSGLETNQNFAIGGDALTNDLWTSTFKITALWGGPSGLVDPNPSLLTPEGRIAVPAEDERGPLVTGGTPRSAVATDGASKLLIRIPSADPLVFSLEAPGYGRFLSLEEEVISGEVDPIQTPFGPWVFVLYEPPVDHPEPSDAPTVDVISVKTDPLASDQVATLPVALFRPPILFVHGLWDKPVSFAGFEAIVREAGFELLWPVAYTNTVGFDPLRLDPRLPDARTPVTTLAENVTWALEAQRRIGNVAVARVFVVAHSMGTLVTRALEHLPTYARRENYMKGDVAKLISIGGPHRGSKLANLLISEPCYGNMFGEWLDKPVFDADGQPRTALTDLRDPEGVPEPTAVEHLNLPNSTMPVHAVVGVAGELAEVGASNVLRILVGAYAIRHPLSLCPIFPGLQATIGEPSDLIVGQSSQEGRGIRNGANLSTEHSNFSNHVHTTGFDALGTAELDSEPIRQAVRALLFDQARFTPQEERP